MATWHERYQLFKQEEQILARGGTREPDEILLGDFYRSDAYKEMLKKVQANGLSIKDAPEEMQHDREIIAEACWQNGMALQYVPLHFRGDLEIVACAVHRHPQALMSLTQTLDAHRA